MVATLEKASIGIIGAGVSGLSCGVWLTQLGYRVCIWHRDDHQSIVSRTAGAVWLPYQAHPREQIEKLSFESYNYFARMAENQPLAGVSMAQVSLFYRRQPKAAAYQLLDKLTPSPLQATRLPKPFTHGWLVQVPFIDTTLYMPFLLKAFKKAGGQILQRHIHTIEQVRDEVDILVNCSGLGARELVGDTSVYPIRGQIIRTEKCPENLYLIDETDDDLPAYIFSRDRDCILGGSAEPQQGNLAPNAQIHEDILQRCLTMAPSLASVKILSQEVGLRPGRPTLRLAREPGGEGAPLILHNYGHGGSGFTVSWGCARQIVQWVGDQCPAPLGFNPPFA